MGILFSEVPVNGFCQRQCAALENVVGLTLYAKTWVTLLYFYILRLCEHFKGQLKT